MPSLEALARLHARGELDLIAVVTQPDRRGNRGRMTSPAVKAAALSLGVTLLQPARLRGADRDVVVALRPDLLVWAAYGNLVPAALLAAVNGRAVNVHASLLPRWRGAAPIAHAILAGDTETGVTLMNATAELDAGPILAAARTGIRPEENTGALTERLGILGGALLERELPRYIAGEIASVPQDTKGVTWAPKLDPRDGALDFAEPADALVRKIRAFTPEPGAYTIVRGSRVGVIEASVSGGSPAEHGTVRFRDRTPHVAAGAGWLRLDRVHPAGRRPMAGAEWSRGIRDIDGNHLPS